MGWAKFWNKDLRDSSKDSVTAQSHDTQDAVYFFYKDTDTLWVEPADFWFRGTDLPTVYLAWLGVCMTQKMGVAEKNWNVADMENCKTLI